MNFNSFSMPDATDAARLCHLQKPKVPRATYIHLNPGSIYTQLTSLYELLFFGGVVLWGDIVHLVWTELVAVWINESNMRLYLMEGGRSEG